MLPVVPLAGTVSVTALEEFDDADDVEEMLLVEDVDEVVLVVTVIGTMFERVLSIKPLLVAFGT